MADDVALHFRCARLDGIAAGAQIPVRPEAVVDGVWIAAQKLPVGTKQFLCNLLEALVELAPEYFLDRSFGPGNAGCRNAAEGAHLIEAHDFDFRATLRQLLTDERIFAGGAAVALHAAG